MLKKFLFFVSLFVFSNITSILFAEIIPLKKPIQTKEEEEHKLLIDTIKPLPKPIINIILKNDEKQTENKIVQKKEDDIGIILPKKKTLDCRV